MYDVPKPLLCHTCARLKIGRIVCRGCGRTLCKHLAKSITDQDGNLYDPLRDRPEGLLGTCAKCSHESGKLRRA